MKQFCIAVLMIALLSSVICVANADTDFSGLTLDELIVVQKKLTEAMWATDDWESVIVPIGVYEVGVDIPAGKWRISGTEGKAGSIYWGESLDRYGVEVEDKIAEFTHWNDEGISWNLIDGTYVSITISPVVFTPYIPATLGFGKKNQSQNEDPSDNSLLAQNEKWTARVKELEEQNRILQERVEELQMQLDNDGNETDASITVEQTPTPIENTEFIRELKFTDTGADVKRVNQRLSDLGFLSGIVFQYYGSITKDAVERFQERVGLPVTGTTDEETLNVLFSNNVTAPPAPSPTPWFEPSTPAKSTISPTYTRLQKGSKGEEVANGRFQRPAGSQFPASQGYNWRPAGRLKAAKNRGIIIVLLTVSEDKATQRCDLSAGTEVSGKGDASSITLFLSSAQAHRCITLSGNPKAINLGGPGAGPRQTGHFTVSRYEQCSRLSSAAESHPACRSSFLRHSGTCPIRMARTDW